MQYPAEYVPTNWNLSTIPMSGKPFTLEGEQKTVPLYSTAKGEKVTIKKSYETPDWNKKNNKRKEVQINMIKHARKNIILGMSGYVGDKLNCIGCSYTSKKEFASFILFKFFFLRHLVKKDEEFKKKWDEKYNELAPEFKMIWRTVNLPDNCFNIIINTCL